MMDIKEILLQWFTNSGSCIKNENASDQQLTEELHKRIIRKFKKRKVQSPIIDNIWDADLADIQLRSKFNKGFRFSVMCNWHLLQICMGYFSER